jgi:hypothetical protein
LNSRKHKRLAAPRKPSQWLRGQKANNLDLIAAPLAEKIVVTEPTESPRQGWDACIYKKNKM